MVEGKMWYGCQSKGVGYIQKNTVTDLSKKGFPEWAVRAMKADDKGNIWVATGGSGLARIYQDKSTSSGYSYKLYGYENGMLSTNIYLVYAIDNKVYCGSENGIDELTLNDQYDVIEAQHYGYDEGFVGVETCQDAVMNDDQGNLWFGTINGLSHFKPNQNATNALTPMVSFTDVRANLSPLAWMGDNTELYLKHFQNTVSFEFVGIDLARPKSVIYSYRLRGNDTTWSVGGPLNSVQFSNLKPGGYKFQVKASSDGKTWSPVRTFGFSISTPFWKTWWFWTLCIVGIALIIWFWFRYRIKNLEQKAEEEKLKYQMKNELLQLEQKALRLQMNPHFLFNALNSIQGLIIKNDQKSARYYLAKFAHLMRQILDNSRNAIISLDEEIKTLENYLLIEKLSKKDTFIYELKVDEEINQATLQIPPMLIQPFIENAIIHAFTGMDKEGKVNINIYRDNALLVVEIIDNGIGRKKAGEISKKGINRPSVGIEVTEQRLNANNEGTASEAVKIVDLQDEDGNPTGTMVVLKIKID